MPSLCGKHSCVVVLCDGQCYAGLTSRAGHLDLIVFSLRCPCPCLGPVLLAAAPAWHVGATECAAQGCGACTPIVFVTGNLRRTSTHFGANVRVSVLVCHLALSTRLCVPLTRRCRN